MAGMKIADLFAQIGFKFNDADLNRFQQRLSAVKAQLTALRGAGNIVITANATQISAVRREAAALSAELTKIKSKQNINITARTTGVGGGSKSGSGSASGMMGGLAGLGGAMGQFLPGAGLAGAAFFGGKALIRTRTELDALKQGFLMATGSAQEAGKMYSWYMKQADDIGFNAEANARGFKNFAVASTEAGLSVAEMKDVFQSVGRVQVALGMSADDTEGTMRALTQMMSKGTVQAEELRGQLGERMPLAVSAMAKAYGISIPELNKMLKAGMVISKEALPKIAKEFARAAESGGAYTDATTKTKFALDKLSNSFLRFKDITSQSLAGGFITVVNLLAKGFDYLGTAVGVVVQWFKAAWNVVKLLWDLLAAAPWQLIGAGLVWAAVATWGWVGAVFVLNGALATLVGWIGVLLSPFILIGVAIAAVVIIFEDLYSCLHGGESQFADWAAEGGFIGAMAQAFIMLAYDVQRVYDTLMALFSVDWGGKWAAISKIWSSPNQVEKPVDIGNWRDGGLGTMNPSTLATQTPSFMAAQTAAASGKPPISIAAMTIQTSDEVNKDSLGEIISYGIMAPSEQGVK